MPIISVKGHGNVKFPDNMAQEDIKIAIDKLIGNKQEQPQMSSTFPGVREVKAPVRPEQTIQAQPKGTFLGDLTNYLNTSIEGTKQAFKDVGGPYEGTMAEKGSSALMRSLGAVGLPAMSYAAAPFVAGASAVNRLAGGYPGQALKGIAEKMSLRGLGLGEEVRKVPVVGENIYSNLLHPKTESGQADVRAIKNALGATLMPGTGSVIETAVKTPGYMISGTGKVVETLGKGGKIPFTQSRYGLSKIAENIINTGEKKAISEITKSKVPSEQIQDVSNRLQKYGLDFNANNPDAVIKKSLDMAYARAKKADEFLIEKAKKGTEFQQPLGISYEIVRPLDAVEKGVLKHINEEIPAGNRAQALKAYKNIKKELSKKYDEGVPISMLPEFKNELGVNWKGGSAISEITESLKNQVRKKMYHEINDKIASLSPETKALNKEAKELFDVAEAMTKVKPIKTNVIKAATAGATIGAGIGGGRAAISAGGMDPSVMIPAAMGAGIGAAGFAGAATLPQMLSKGTMVGRKMQDLGSLMKGEIPTPRPGSIAYEKSISMTPEQIKAVKNKIDVDKFWEDIRQKVRKSSEEKADLERMKLAPKPEEIPPKKTAPVTQGVSQDTPEELFKAAQTFDLEKAKKRMSELVASGHMTVEDALAWIDHQKDLKRLSVSDWETLKNSFQPLGSIENPVSKGSISANLTTKTGVPKKDQKKTIKMDTKEYENLKELMPELWSKKLTPKERVKEMMKLSKKEFESEQGLYEFNIPDYNRQIKLIEKTKDIKNMSSKDLEELASIDISNQSPPYASPKSLIRPMTPNIMEAKKLAVEELSIRKANAKKFIY